MPCATRSAARSSARRRDGLTQAESRRMETARRVRERADLLAQANAGTPRDRQGAGSLNEIGAVSGAGIFSGVDMFQRLGATSSGLAAMQAHSFLAMLRERYGARISGHKHRGLFTGEPIAIAGDAIKADGLRASLEAYCKPYRSSVSVDRLQAVMQSKRAPEDVARLDQECVCLPRERGSGHRIISAESQDLLWHIPDALTFPAFKFDRKSHKRRLQKSISRAVARLFKTHGRRSPTKSQEKQYNWHYGFTPPAEDDTIRHAMSLDRPNPGLGDADEMVLHLGIWPDQAFRTFGLTKDTCQTTSKGKRTISQFYTDMTEPLHVDPHKDAGDIKNGWVAMLCTGEFEGGLLVLPELGIKLNYRPGDVVFMRSSLVEHFISDYIGQRTSMVFFTKGTAKSWLEAEPEQEVQPWLRLRMERKLYEFEMAEKRAQKPIRTEHFKPYDKRAKS